ncbi:unnamed protein product [Diatraea saccharalis]|uniref:Remodeling and spacing factor 1 n=1 Tax=Diatraea saccharalis TaxID=40085 RepID=A0A9P0C6R5_9NEOP|nr:unnamed protein product [Diatraea saccharalis]
MASDGEISCTNDPNFAVIYSFLKVFGKLYGLEIPTIAKLQECIENTQEVLDPLKELHLRLLRRALKSVQSNRWERCLIKFCHQQGNHQEAWEIERFSYKKASTQVKLKVLKHLLEYQFTCHPKFKSAVNSIVCKELRLDPIGRDKNGCVYWYQVDDDANLCLYKEDQDEETWQLVARNREELVKVITQLKKGEDICPLFSNAAHEDSSSADVPPQLEPVKPEVEEENEEEFLSPESESEHEELPVSDDIIKAVSKTKELDTISHKEDVSCSDKNTSDQNNRISITQEIEDETKMKKDKELPEVIDGHSKVRDEVSKNNEDSSEIDLKLSKDNVDLTISDAILKKDDDITNKKEQATIKESPSDCKENQELYSSKNLSKEDSECDEKNNTPTENKKDVKDEIEKEDIVKIKAVSSSVTEELGEAIEEPLMVVKEEGNGADCESSYIGEEIVEDVMFFYGEGNGYDNDTGNPEIIEQGNSPEKNSDAENGNDDLQNGEHELTNSNSKNNKLSKTVKIKTSTPTVTKRALKKQPNDTNEVLKSDSKKHCIRSLNKSDSSNSKNVNKELQQEICVNDKSNTESESPWKSRIKKGRTKIKKKKVLSNKTELNERKKDVNNLSVNYNDSKTSIIEKRKSSVSSVEQEDAENADTEKEKSPDKDLKVEEPLPPKKIRLESTPESDIKESAPPEKDPLDVNNSNDIKNASVDNKDNIIETDSIAQRKKIKASKGKFKRKKFFKNTSDNDSTILNKSADKDDSVIKEKKVSKSLKRSLLESTMSDKSKSESHSDSDDDEPVSSGKRLKTRPKKIITSSRKKVEAKLLEKHSTDESEEETLYSLAGKKASKKIFKKKSRGKEPPKGKAKVEKGDSEDSDVAPVRQSRRIAQMKIKEEAERRHLEEVALRELKMIHKKKNKDEEEWHASGASSSEGSRWRRWGARGGRGGRGAGAEGWRAADSTGPDQDSDSDEPLFELHEEPDLDFNKSDHEFSPESDLESGEPAEPLKRARTLQEGKDDGFCKRCGSGEQPEWILLCDRCDEGYHASCLKPMLFLVPEGDWFCPGCNHENKTPSPTDAASLVRGFAVSMQLVRTQNVTHRREVLVRASFPSAVIVTHQGIGRPLMYQAYFCTMMSGVNRARIGPLPGGRQGSPGAGAGSSRMRASQPRGPARPSRRPTPPSPPAGLGPAGSSQTQQSVPAAGRQGYRARLLAAFRTLEPSLSVTAQNLADRVRFILRREIFTPAKLGQLRLEVVSSMSPGSRRRSSIARSTICDSNATVASPAPAEREG